MVLLRGRIYKPLPGGSIINHKSQKLNYLRASRFTPFSCLVRYRHDLSHAQRCRSAARTTASAGAACWAEPAAGPAPRVAPPRFIDPEALPRRTAPKQARTKVGDTSLHSLWTCQATVSLLCLSFSACAQEKPSPYSVEGEGCSADVPR